MIDHAGARVTDLPRSREFYRQALAPLGYVIFTEFRDEATGYGAEGYSDFWLEAGDGNRPPVHVAFRAASRSEVENFHSAALAALAALAAGGRDNGSPRLRNCEPGYFAALVLDPDGHNIEAVYNESTG